MSVQQIRAALRLQLRPRTPAALTSSDTSLPASDRSPLASTHTSRFGRLAAAIPGSQAHMLPRRTFVSHVSPREFQSEGPAARGPHQRLRQRALLYREWQEKRRKEREAKTARVQVLDEEKAKRARERAESQVGEVVISKRGKAVQVRQNPRYAPNPVVPWERQLKKGSNNWRKRRSMILRARRQMYAPPGQFTAFNAHTDYDPFVRHAPKIQLPDLRGQTFLDVKVAGTDDRVSHGVRDQLHARIIGDTQAHPLRHATLAGTQPEYASLEGRPLQPAQKLLSSSERFFRATGVDGMDSIIRLSPLHDSVSQRALMMCVCMFFFSMCFICVCGCSRPSPPSSFSSLPDSIESTPQFRRPRIRESGSLRQPSGAGGNIFVQPARDAPQEAVRDDCNHRHSECR